MREHPPTKQLLALDPDLGSIFVCQHCGNIHLQIAGMHLKTDLRGFQALTVLLHRAAANFELWAGVPGGAVC